MKVFVSGGVSGKGNKKLVKNGRSGSESLIKVVRGWEWVGVPGARCEAGSCPVAHVLGVECVLNLWTHPVLGRQVSLLLLPMQKQKQSPGSMLSSEHPPKWDCASSRVA